MYAQAFEDPFAFLYETTGNRFPGYKPEGKFHHGESVVVAHIPAATEEGFSSVISETRMPAEFFKAVISDNAGPRLQITTGSGEGIAELLYTLCTAFAEGRVQMLPSRKFCHTMGVGSGFDRVSLCFAEPDLAMTVGAQIRCEMLAVRKAK